MPQSQCGPSIPSLQSTLTPEERAMTRARTSWKRSGQTASNADEEEFCRQKLRDLQNRCSKLSDHIPADLIQPVLDYHVLRTSLVQLEMENIALGAPSDNALSTLPAPPGTMYSDAESVLHRVFCDRRRGGHPEVCTGTARYQEMARLGWQLGEAGRRQKGGGPLPGRSLEGYLREELSAKSPTQITQEHDSFMRHAYQAGWRRRPSGAASTMRQTETNSGPGLPGSRHRPIDLDPQARQPHPTVWSPEAQSSGQPTSFVAPHQLMNQGQGGFRDSTAYNPPMQSHDYQPHPMEMEGLAPGFTLDNVGAMTLGSVDPGGFDFDVGPNQLLEPGDNNTSLQSVGYNDVTLSHARDWVGQQPPG